MIAHWSRRFALIGALATLSWLTGCSSSTIASAITPKRLVSFGDTMSDVGQQGGLKYTVNDGTVNSWLDEVATSFALTVSPSGTGGTAYGRVLARVGGTTNAAGAAGTLSVTQQIDAFLAKDNFTADDIVFINGGANDLIAEMNDVLAGKQTQAQAIAKVKQAGNLLAAQVMRLVDKGAQQVVVMGTYNLGQTPWAIGIGKQVELAEMTSRFNESMLVPIVAQGKHVLYVDITYYLNLITNPASAPIYGLSNVIAPICTTIDPGVGIGTGTGKINSLNCTASTLTAGADMAIYAFADELNFTPVVNRMLGDYIYSRVRLRW